MEMIVRNGSEKQYYAIVFNEKKVVELTKDMEFHFLIYSVCREYTRFVFELVARVPQREGSGPSSCFGEGRKSPRRQTTYRK